MSALREFPPPCADPECAFTRARVEALTAEVERLREELQAAQGESPPAPRKGFRDGRGGSARISGIWEDGRNHSSRGETWSRLHGQGSTTVQAAPKGSA